MFDKLLLISEGYPVYYGKARESMEYFSSLRFIPEIAMNPAEFLLDLATGQVTDISVPEALLASRCASDSERAVIKVRTNLHSYLFPTSPLSPLLHIISFDISIFNSNTKPNWNQKKRKRIIETQRHRSIFSWQYKSRKSGHSLGGISS